MEKLKAVAAFVFGLAMAAGAWYAWYAWEFPLWAAFVVWGVGLAFAFPTRTLSIWDAVKEKVPGLGK